MRFESAFFTFSALFTSGYDFLYELMPLAAEPTLFGSLQIDSLLLDTIHYDSEVQPFYIVDRRDWTIVLLNYEEFWAPELQYLDEEGLDIRYSFKYTLADAKLYYPEPYIASPSYIHSDLTFLCILQYWYWLWFIFIYLIALFFLSFLCVVRWCATHKKPSRETQGVSRSKCGDLITACVPVSWAASIIISESTDAADVNDGFGTGEIVVGIRAYQWGWEYYYPRSIDLIYNVTPTYSAFIGNSLKYNHASNTTNSSMDLWRQYQTKLQDAPVTPASLLFNSLSKLPNGSQNFMTDAGLNNLDLAASFPKIRNNTKIYNTHLITQPTLTNIKNYQMVNYYSSMRQTSSTLDYTNERISNLVSAISVLSPTITDLTSQRISSLLETISTNKSTTLDVSDEIYTLSNKITPHLTTTDCFLATPTLADIEDKILPTEQSVQQQRFTNPFKLEIFSSCSVNPILSNLTSNSPLSALNNLYLDVHVLGNLSNRVFTTHSFAPVPSSSVARAQSELNVIEGTSFTKTSSLTPTTLNKGTSVNLSTTLEANTGSIDKIPSALINLYWSTCWANLSPELRFEALQTSAIADTQFYLPQFTNYADYDFRNEQSLLLMEDMFWETPYPTFTFYDYLALADSYVKGELPLPRVTELETLFTPSSLAFTPEVTKAAESNHFSSFVTLHAGEGFSQPAHLTTTSLSTLTLNTDSQELDDSYRTTKLETFKWNHHQPHTILLPETRKYYTVASKVFNNFTTSHEEFTPQSPNALLSAPLTNVPKGSLSHFFSHLEFKRTRFQSAWFWNSTPCAFPYTLRFFNQGMVGVLRASKASFGYWYQAPFFSSIYSSLTTSLTSIYVTVDATSNWSRLSNLESYAYVFTLRARTPFNNFIQKNIWALRSFEFKFNGKPVRVYGTALFTLRRNYTKLLPLCSVNLNIWDERCWAGANTNFNVNSTVTNQLATSYESMLGSELKIRASVKDSIVNYNAFQKVFRSRLDENRSHTSLSNFKTLGLSQPFINDKNVPYVNMLGKNRSFFFQTPFYTQTYAPALTTLNSIFTQNNTQTFEFPFLEALQSDLIRYTWMDGYSKWRYVEVQPASVSKYSLVGVPYLRKPYDFNTNTGDNLSDLQSYFTRSSRARKNYLPNWLYSPILFNRALTTNSISNLIATLQLNSFTTQSLYNFLLTLKTLKSFKSYNYNLTGESAGSISGNSIYSKSTWRPQTGVSSYYHDVPHLVEILTKREHLIRDYLLTQKKVTYLPLKMTSNPQNPLLRTVISSFNFTNPLALTSNYSREYLYSSLQYFKFLELQGLARYFEKTSSVVPFNTTLINEYTLFYFLNTDTAEFSKSNELYRNQFRPLRKGVNSMLRLHATGAIAMPIEVRLQILASSRDVIHSWSVPSAGIKIDCIPGYTSHRIMKFMITGIYWGQCQEICGRYHHWMPIVVYFIKRDLFFLWCTHFVYKSRHYDNWEISDKKFANFLRFVSYDKSSWLTEVSQFS